MTEFDFSQLVGSIIGAGVFGYIAINFFIGLFSPSATPLNLSEIEIGYIKEPVVNPASRNTYQETPYDEVAELKRKVELLKLQKQLKELEGSSVDNELLNECVDALVALGTPKRKAKAEAETILENKNIKTVQEFITEYGKK